MAEQPFKKSKLKDLIDFWNSSFPEHPINENHIKNPDEVSFRYNIILCLSNLNINTTSFATIDNESGSRLKASRCRLVAWTNEILKTASGLAAFKICYLDLLNPKRHCVLNCLHYLSNYVAFFREVYSSISHTHKQIKELEDMKTQRNDLKRMIEAAKLSRNAQAQMATFKERSDRYKKELQNIQEEKKKCDFKIDELRAQIDSIGKNIVSEHEAKSILETKETVKAQYLEHEEIVNFERNRLQGMSQDIEKVQLSTTKMEHIIATSKIDVRELTDIKREYESLNANIIKMRDRIAESTQQIQIFTQLIEKKKKIIAELTVQESQAEKSYNQIIKVDKNLLKQRESILRELESKENSLHDEQMVIKEEMGLMYNVSSVIIKQMSESYFS